MTWTTKHEYVDLETGETLTKLPDGYYKAKQIQVKTKIIHNAGKYHARGERTITHGIRKSESKQLTLTGE